MYQKKKTISIMDRLDENKWATLRVLDYSDAKQTEDYNKAGKNDHTL